MPDTEFPLLDADLQRRVFTPNPDPAQGAKQDAGNTTLASILAKLIAAPATEAKQDSTITAIGRIGTRAYGATIARLGYTGASAASGAIAAEEVLLHNCGNGRCFVKAGAEPSATVDDIRLEPGEKVHLRLTSGHMIAALQDDEAGNLNIIAVV